jgi:uncharacterized protein YqgC (DUF456 family)
MKNEIKYAILFVFLSFIWNCIEYFTGLQNKYINIHPYFVTTFFILMTSVIYFLATREKKRARGGRITFMQGLITGMTLTLFILILNPAALYLFSEFINPNFYNSFIRHDVLTGKYSVSEANDYYNLPNFIKVGTLYRFIMGMFATVIISFFMKGMILEAD